MEFIQIVEKSNKDPDISIETGRLIIVHYNDKFPIYVKANHEIELEGKLVHIEEYDRKNAETLRWRRYHETQRSSAIWL